MTRFYFVYLEFSTGDLVTNEAENGSKRAQNRLRACGPRDTRQLPLYEGRGSAPQKNAICKTTARQMPRIWRHRRRGPPSLTFQKKNETEFFRKPWLFWKLKFFETDLFGKNFFTNFFPVAKNFRFQKSHGFRKNSVPFFWESEWGRPPSSVPSNPRHLPRRRSAIFGRKMTENVKKSDFSENRKNQCSVAQRVLVLLGWLAVQNTPIFYTLSEKETLVNIYATLVLLPKCCFFVDPFWLFFAICSELVSKRQHSGSKWKCFRVYFWSFSRFFFNVMLGGDRFYVMLCGLLVFYTFSNRKLLKNDSKWGVFKPTFVQYYVKQNKTRKNKKNEQKYTLKKSLVLPKCWPNVDFRILRENFITLPAS